MSKIVHFEIPADEPQKLLEFYGRAFGWQFQQFGDQGYWLTTAGPDEEAGIGGAIMQKNGPDHPVTNVINVPNVDEACRSVEANGGMIVVPKFEVGGMGYVAYFKDPEGTIMGLWETIPQN